MYQNNRNISKCINEKRIDEKVDTYKKKQLRSKYMKLMN